MIYFEHIDQNHLMRTLIDIPDAQLQSLSHICETLRVSRAHVVREAIAAYLAQQSKPNTAQAFGAWGSGEDGVAFQQRLRSEWS